MTSVPVPPIPGVESNPLARFLQRVQAHNPFLDNRVNAPSTIEPDVASIHEAAFVRLTTLAGEALQVRRGLGALLWGEAGIGKSHLLSRLGRWANGRACFVYLHNLQAAPETLPRSLLRAVVSILTLGQRRLFQPTPLFNLVHGAVLQSVPADQRVLPWGHIDHAFHSWLDGLGRQDLPGSTLLDRTVDEVLFRFFRSVCELRFRQGDGRAAGLAVRWLSGDGLEPEEATLLRLPPAPHRDEPVALADNQQIKQVLVALTRLAATQQRPFVLAFDQVDNLDAEQFAALARFLEALIDSSPNLLVVTAGIQATLLRWREQGVIQESAWDRLAQSQVPLQRITPDQAVQLVRTRLQAFLQPFADVPAVAERLRADPLFPLGQAWYDRHLRDKVDLRPRDVINWACEGWRELQERLHQNSGAAWPAEADSGSVAPPRTPRKLTEEEVQELIDRRVKESVADHLAMRQRETQGLPPDEDRLASLVYELLGQCREAAPGLGLLSVTRKEIRNNVRPPHQVELVQQLPPPVVARSPDRATTVRTGLLVVTESNRNAVANGLRRLLAGAGAVDRQVLVTDGRVGLRLGEKGEEYLQNLEEQGPQKLLRVELTFSEYAELDALQAVVGLARSGELEIEPGPGQARKLTAGEAIASLQRQNRYLGCRLLRELLAPARQQEPVQA